MDDTAAMLETFQEARRLLDLHGKNIDRAKRNTKGCAYQMALAVNQMLHDNKSEFLARVATDYPDCENAFDAWLDDQFLLLTAIGESHKTVFRAIADGKTIEQYAGVGVEQSMSEFSDLEFAEFPDLGQVMDDMALP